MPKIKFQYMIKSALSGMLILFAVAATAQVQTQVIGDTVRIRSNTGTAELILENSTKNVNGFLFNKGNGKTEFRKGYIKLNDSLYVFGGDTLNLGGSGLFWKLLGNSGTNPSTNFVGTTDSAKLVFKTFNKQRVSIFENGVVNIGLNDTTSKPVFRFYPNGDFAAGATNDYTPNQFETKNGIRFNKKLGILEVGVSNNLDTSLSVSQGLYQTSGLIVNSDNHNTIGGTMISSIISGDGITLGAGKVLNWSIVSGEQHYLNGGIRKSTINGWGNQIYSSDFRSSIMTGDINRMDSTSIDNLINGFANRDYDSSYSTLVTGSYNRFSGNSQLLAGINLISKNWAATTLGSANVDFSSLPAVKINKPASLKNYPVFAIGNSNDYNTTRSNAVTILYSGRTQINTTGYDTTLSEASVTPKAALEVVSKNSGVLLPKLTNAQRNSIAAGDLHNGLLLYNTDSSKFQFYDGSIWKSISQSYTLSDGDKGDISLSSSGAIWAIDNNTISDAKFRQSAGLSLVGNAINSTANVADIAAGTDNQVMRRSGTSIGFGAVNIASGNAVTGVLPAANGGTNYAIQSLSDASGTITWNATNGINAAVTLSGAGRTLSITNPVAGQTYTIRLIQDGTGSRTVTTWPTNSQWTNGIAPTLSTIAGRYEIVALYYDGTNYYGTYHQNFQTPSSNVSIYSADAKNGIGSTVHSLTGVPAGALLVITTTFEAAQNNCAITSSPSLTWTKRSDASQSVSGDAEIWTAVFTAGGSITVTSDWPTVGTNYQSSVCYVVINQESSFGGAAANDVSEALPSVDLITTRANSIIFCASSDWNSMDGASRTYRNGATETLYFRDPDAAAFYHYYKPAATVTTYTVGISAPTGQSSGTAVIEIRGN